MFIEFEYFNKLNSTFFKKLENTFGLSELTDVIAKPARYNSCPDSAQLSLDSRPGKTKRERERERERESSEKMKVSNSRVFICRNDKLI